MEAKIRLTHVALRPPRHSVHQEADLPNDFNKELLPSGFWLALLRVRPPGSGACLTRAGLSERQIKKTGSAGGGDSHL